VTGQPRRPRPDVHQVTRRRRGLLRGRDRTATTPSLTRTGVRRIRWLLLVYALVVLVTVGKLVEIQVVNATEYSDRGVRQRARTLDLQATRGRIYDREGDVLATSVQAATIYADPRVFRGTETPDGLPVPPAAQPAEVAAALAPVLDMDAAAIEDRLGREAHFVYLRRQLDHEVGQEVRALGLPGIGVLTEPRRVYPAGGLAGQVVGFTGIDGEGLQGLEAQYDGILRGQPGMLVLERAPGGLDIASGMRELVPPEAGTDLVLTIDREIQHAAERAAAAAVEEFNAVGAGVLVLEVGTGDILAMASVPSYDPNARGSEDPADRRNRAVTDVFEPGSTQKALTVAAAIEEGLITSSSTYEVPSAISVGGSRFTDAYQRAAQRMTVAEIMERSSNVGTIQIAQDLGPERLDAYLRSFGYGRATGLGFPGESPGLLMPQDQWWGTSLPTISIGHGVAVSLLQLGTSYSTLANDGVAVQPRLVRGTVGDDGRLTPAASPAEERIVSEGTAKQVQAMLELAVAGEHGTGARASVDGYRVAGKTGTARKPSADARGYSGEYIATFVGFAPVDAPRIVVAVMVDEPRPFFGGLVAAPVFSEVMAAALIARQVQPDDAGRSLPDAIRAAQLAAEQHAIAAAEAQGTAPTSPPAGSPAGGDGAAVDGGDDP
jgi:cell division protein FtsI (penicillin-binding protein 3)